MCNNSPFLTSSSDNGVQELLTAGTDTVAATLEWALLELVRHPQVLDRLQKEIDAKCGMSSQVDEDEAVQLPYLQVLLFML